MMGIMPGEWDWQDQFRGNPLGRNPLGGILDGGGIFSGPRINGGVMGDDAAAAKRDAMMAAAAQLLAGSGYSPTRRSFGELVGQAMMAGQGARQQSLAQSQDRRLKDAQIKKIEMATDDPASVREYEYAVQNGFKGSFQDWTVAGGQSSRPSSVQEWEFYSSLAPEQQKLYLEMKRNPDMVVREVGGVPTVVDPTRSGTTTTPLSTLPQEAAAKGALAGAEASGKLAGQTQAEAQFDLPRVEANARQTISLLDKIKKHPGLDYGVGLWSKAPVIPGTSQADFVALTEQLRGKQFLEAYQTLKGGGQITEVEGTKAENAIARMQRAQSKESFVEAATEFQDVIQRGVDRARKKAGAPSQAGEVKRRRYNPQSGKIE